MKTKYKFKYSYPAYILRFFTFYFCMAIFTSIISIYLKGIGKNPTEISFIASATNVFSLILLPVMGYLNDTVKRPVIIPACSMGIFAVLSLVFAFTEASFLLFVLNGFIMTAISCVSTISEKTAASCKYRYGSVRIWGTIGYAVAAQLSGVILELVSPIWLFIFCAIAAVFAIIGILFTSPVASAEEMPEKKKDKPQGKLKDIITPTFLFFLLVAFIFSGISSVNMTYIPILLEELSVPVSSIGTVLSLSTLAEIPLIIFSYKFMDRFSVKFFMFLSFGLMLLQTIVYSQFSKPAVVIAVVILFKAIASTLYMMVSLKAVRNIVNPLFITTGLSVVNAVNSLAGILMQNLSGYIVSNYNTPTLYAILSIPVALGLIVTIFLKVSNNNKVFSK